MGGVVLESLLTFITPVKVLVLLDYHVIYWVGNIQYQVTDMEV